MPERGPENEGRHPLLLADQISFAHQLGQLEGRINALERKVDAFEQRIEGRLGAIEAKLDNMATLLNLGRGGWQAMAVIGAIAAALASAAAWVVEHIR